MKSVTRFVLVAVLVLSLGFVLSACSSGGGGDSGGGGPSMVVTQPSTTTQAQQAASTGAQGASTGSGSASTFQSFGNVGLTSTVGAPPMKVRNVHKLGPGLAAAQRLSGKFAKSSAVAKATAAIKKAKTMNSIASAVTLTGSGGGTCTDSGSYSYEYGIDEATLTYTSTITFDHCREAGSDINGSFTMTGSANATGAYTLTETIGTTSNKFSILEFSDDTYSMLVARFESAMTLVLSGNGNGDVTMGYTATMTANGTMDVLDYLTLNKYNMTYSSMSFAYTYTATTNVDEFTINGGFSESWTYSGTSYGVAMKFENFYVMDDWDANSITMDETITGKFGIDFTPDNCFEAGYSFQTVTPIHYNSLGVTTAGHIIVNSVVDIYFNADGTVDVTLNGVIIYDNVDPYDLSLVCEFQTTDEDAPVSSGSTGTASGSTMTVTSLSANSSTTDGIGLNCFTDIHVNYYSTSTPTASTTGTWYIDYHVTDSSSVPAGSTLVQYRDIDADGTADVGLDINGWQQDSVSDGLEHFSAYKLPVGYYVISMNNWDCPTTVSNKVNLQIGNNVFGPVTCTYTASDTDGTTLGAWCRVADVVVTASGVTVNLGTDINTTLDPWHDSPTGFNMPATSVSKARGMK